MTPAEISAAELMSQRAERTTRLEDLILALDCEKNGESLADFIKKLRAVLDLKHD